MPTLKSVDFIVRIEGYEGDDTAVYLEGDRDGFLYCIGTCNEQGVIALVDFGYRSVAEARRAWPDALTPEQMRERGLLQPRTKAKAGA